jgi:hypothetical protein
MPILSAHDTFTITAAIANGAALSDAFRFSRFSSLIIRMPAAWTAASLGFHVSNSQGGTYVPLYDEDGSLVEITSPAVDKAYTAPAALAGAHWVKLWSETGGSGVNQAAARTLGLDLKT